MKATLVLAAVTLLSTSAYAGPSLDSLLAKVKAPTSRPTMSVDRCSNFGGSWHGQCVDSDGVIEESDLTIEQSGCQSVKIGEFMALGETKSETTIGTDAKTFARSLAWNSDQSELNLAVLGIGVAEVPTSFDIWINISSVDGRLVEKQVARSRTVGAGLDGAGTSYESTCTYDRAR